jgi:hypothetical protein
MGGLLAIVTRFAGKLPFGAIALVLGLNGLLFSALGGRFAPLLAALVARVVGDVLLRFARPSAARAHCGCSGSVFRSPYTLGTTGQ